MGILENVKFNEQGLVPAIAQDAESGEVLMMAWMNRESLLATLERKVAVYWSRSRGKLWVKGESSGHMQDIVDVRLDCDGDTILLSVRQKGGACHTGFRSCFYRKAEGGEWIEDGVKIFDPSSVYGQQ